MNDLLKRQIERHLGDSDRLSSEYRTWLEDISQTYDDYEAEARHLRRTLEMTRQEVVQAAATRSNGAIVSEQGLLSITLRSIGDGVIAASSGGKVVLINRVAEYLTGWPRDEALDKPLEDVFNVVDRHSGMSFTGGEEAASKETQQMAGLLISRDGTEKAVSSRLSPMHDEDGSVVGVVIVFRDLTEERRRDDERLRASKLESIGLLAGGIAHDFNNFLTAILGNTTLVRMQLKGEPKLSELLGRSEAAARQARDLTQQLLTFSVGGSPAIKTVSARGLVEECASFALRGSNVRCEVQVEEGISLVEVDRGQITQVLHNLIINANQAMPDGGVIGVQAVNEKIEAFDPRPLTPGNYVTVTVGDEGVGIPFENLDKIFDPYFSTKKKGSGLGLATSYSIVRNHQGSISVESEPGQGTTFTVYLPASRESGEATVKAAVERISEGSGRVLVMDDDAAVRGVAESILEHLGYEAVGAGDGEEMCDLYRRAHEGGKPFDVVIMDLTIPGGMGGSEAVARVLEIDPEARVVVASGYSNDPILGNFKSHGFQAVLKKPFDVEGISRALNEARRK